MALLALFPLLMIGTVLVVALSIHDEEFAWDGTSTLSQTPAREELQLAA
jgi:uncharacterized BrkB/YihY/UPF0761 family membrane protein